MERRPPPTRRTPTWTAPEELIDLMGAVSGNERNGHGETVVRRPNVVMWSWTEPFPHRPMQDLISRRHVEHAELRKVLRYGDRDPYRPAALAPTKEVRSPEAWVDAIRTFVFDGSDIPVDDVGVARVRPEWVYEGHDVPEVWAVLLVVEMDHAELAQAPSWQAGAEVQRQYNRGTAAARALADWLRARGHDARGHGGPNAGPMLLVPAAIEAGLGELGKHGSMIHPRLGSRFRLASVLTDVPLVASGASTFGADDFCWNCRVCLDACPPGAIFSAKQTVRGETKWYVDFDLCLPYFAETHSCGICLAVCPWSQPGEAERLVGTMARKLERRRARATAADESPS
ncbi:MAG: 4Fe-4S dicluster domain-containing protein [Actinomycetota bacterium]